MYTNEFVGDSFEVHSDHSSSTRQVLDDLSKGDMKAADFLAEGEDDFNLSDIEEEEDQADNMSLASDLDDDELEEVERRQKELEKKKKKKK